MNYMKIFSRILLILLALFLWPVSSQAYIGPGAGFAILGSFMVFFFAFLAALMSVLVWPVRAVVRFIQIKRSGLHPHVKRVVIVGLDGLDPDYARELMDQGKLPNLDALSKQGCFHKLRTTFPSMSPVAWSTFATGVNPGKHNIYDFLTPDRRTYLPTLSSTHIGKPERTLKLGRYRIPLSRPEIRLLRRSVPFWKILGDHWVFSHILRVPITFPPEKFYGALLSAMCVPDLKGTQGTFTYFRPQKNSEVKHTGGVEVALEKYDRGYRGYLPGPENSLTETNEELRIPFSLSPNGTSAVSGKNSTWWLEMPDQRLELKVGEYSDWVQLGFRAAPGIKVSGIARFLLLGKDSEPGLYLTPINIDPASPAMPISHPSFYSILLAKLQGPYATLGLAEDTWGLNERVLDEDAFLNQAWKHHAEREAMFFHALRRTRRGACVCVFDATDRIQHMFFRYKVPDHPANRDKDTEKHCNAIEELYTRMDEMIGRVRAEIGNDDVLMVISDHGFKPFRRGVNLNSWLWKNGYLACKSSSGSGEMFENVDWDRTRAYALGLSGIYLNLKGRESKGVVEGGSEADALIKELSEKLTGILDPGTGEVAINRAYLAKDVLFGPYQDNAPELIIGYNQGYRASWDGTLGVVNDVVFEDNLKSWSGDHIMDPKLVPGVFFSNRRIDEQDPGLVDIAATVLALFDIRIPGHMDGKPLFHTENLETLRSRTNQVEDSR